MTGTEELNSFAVDVHQEVLAAAEAVEDGAIVADEFTRWMISLLADVGEIDDAEACFYQARGMESSGYSVDDELGVLNLFVTRYTASEPPETVLRSEVTTAFGRLREFYRRSRDGLYESLEEASPAFDMGQSIHAFAGKVRSLRLFLVTDGLTTLDLMKGELEEGVEVSFHVWDLRRAHRAVTSGTAREPISIDFLGRYGAALPCVTAGAGHGEYTAYLAVMPGEVLADIYDEFGPRLLERNVRSFLQARGKVNQGIRNTILQEPAHFLAYNNGISITAARLRLDTMADGNRGIGALDDLQIVNGGQTTASIHAAKRKDSADLSGLSVAAKVTVVDPERMGDFVPNITRFANSQNRVNEADFSANDPFHVQLERLSRTIWAPAVDGTQRQTRWFYERARGQYADALAREGTPGRQRAFKAINPVSQKFSKTDLAKFENAWASLPHIVSLGAEKNFRDFTIRLADRGKVDVTEDYFQRLIAKAILFRQTEKLVSGQRFGGYRANIVAYSIAYLSHVTAQRLDLGQIWRAQRLAEALESAVTAVILAVHPVITNPPHGANVTEWSKRKECWKAVLELDVGEARSLPAHLLLPDSRVVGSKKQVLSDYEDPKEKALVDQIAAVPAETWFALSRWAKETNNLEGWQRGIAFSLGKLATTERRPSLKQCAQAQKILVEAARLGFRSPE